ncbi:hypothetical protein SAMN04488056_10310 [Cohaesibacter marisflavi]|uniref:Bbp19-like phage domain-containing protein n=1 Tax=Cohaesibacter marisflavi TaxID=655353 RepID=A0A1I5E3L2_9HYPH|nr:hypothetical protein [Cohaesibacter marisflavi]SFO06026.1 hypothetical protein SAMN04488056_10310 [Cohaesibacter marisflavi]
MRLWNRASKDRAVLQAKKRLVEAWMRFSEGKASKDDFEIIMADLANFSGWDRYCDHPPDNAEAQFNEGKRSVFGRAFSFLTMTRGERIALSQAALEEARAEEGV